MYINNCAIFNLFLRMPEHHIQNMLSYETSPNTGLEKKKID
jgi:hypothetical protein